MKKKLKKQMVSSQVYVRIFYYNNMERETEIKNIQQKLIRLFIIFCIILHFTYLLIAVFESLKNQKLSIAFYIEFFVLILFSTLFLKCLPFLYSLSFRFLVNLNIIFELFLISSTSLIFFYPNISTDIMYFSTLPLGFYLVNSKKTTIIFTVLIVVIIFAITYIGKYDYFPHRKGLDVIRPILDIIPVIASLIIISIEIDFIIDIMRINHKFDLKEKYNTEKIIHQRSKKDENLYQIYLMINERLKTDKLYLDPYFNMEKLTKIVNSNRTYVSTALNQFGNTNFNELINELRIKKVLEDLHNDEHNRFTFTHLYQKAGFLHQPKFNRAFKKETGLSPTEYIKSLENAGKEKVP
ncbi:helix-turn-helix domain-containing protein [Chryseobacterium sp. SL1]|uniref:helix-turn-helix domain-containing protein n=1 Tax=Chryseobacterium sp. SL1 TaxID=2995159 RepID=UPI00227475C4|nr:helix-turn-helix domain-containing protein [Chryseobacterium sp. SL1]MCY1660188.1 helix-turn-helix domain-containing protein [Chryseobacterium sp. SL1]